MTTGTAPVKYIVGILTNKEDLRQEALRHLKTFFGEPDFIGRWHPFPHTSSYTAEMGEDLKRSFVSFEKLMAPEMIYKAKVASCRAEDSLRGDGNRLVNIDPGYIDYFKVVLASGKYGGHRIAVAKGCWADLLMMYSKGRWQPMPWCFPDLAGGTYDADLLEIRRLFKAARQQMENIRMANKRDSPL